jgi:hypothetical protein
VAREEDKKNPSSHPSIHPSPAGLVRISSLLRAPSYTVVLSSLHTHQSLFPHCTPATSLSTKHPYNPYYALPSFSGNPDPSLFLS